MALRDVIAVLLVLSGATVPANANDNTAWGRMICVVVGSRTISADDTHSEFGSRLREDFPIGTEFDFEYGLDDASGLTIHLSETAKLDVLIDETFPANKFIGISQVTNIAEFRATYSEATFGQHRMNYKGSDQLFLKTQCGGEEWSGHFVKTHISGVFTQVVSLDCRNFVDARDEVFARLLAVR
jgi:hypothetical protein